MCERERERERERVSTDYVAEDAIASERWHGTDVPLRCAVYVCLGSFSLAYITYGCTTPVCYACAGFV